MSKSPASRTRPSRRSKSPAAAPKRRRTAVAAAGERLGSFEKLLDDETNERVSTAIQAELDLQFDIQIDYE